MQLTNPYYAKYLKKEGILDLKIVKNFFIPTQIDLKKITESIKNCKTVVDIGSGYGLLTNELAKLNPEIKFLGIDTMYNDKKFPMPKPEKNVTFKFTGIEAMTCERFHKKIKKYDGVICSWMPDQSDWRKMLAKISNKKIILVLSTDFSTGTLETYFGMKQFDFQLENRWESGESIIEIWKHF